MKRTFAVLALALSARALTAQSTPLPATRATIFAGLNVATFTGDGSPDNRAGFIGGVGIVRPIAPDWSFQPELAFSMKGATAREGDVKAAVKLSYIEIPLLLRWDLPTSTMARPFFHAGPAVAFRVGCRAELSADDVTLSSSCDNDESDVKTLDLGVMFGGGVAFKHMDHTASIGVRYNVGMNDVVDNRKNRVLSFIATFEWPWGH